MDNVDKIDTTNTSDTIDTGALADIAGITTAETYGIVGMAAPTLRDGIAKLLPRDRWRRGVTVSETEDGLVFDIYVIAEYGVNFQTVSANLASAVHYALTSSTTAAIDDVVIHVVGVHSESVAASSADDIDGSGSLGEV